MSFLSGFFESFTSNRRVDKFNKYSLFLWELEEHWFVYFQLITKIYRTDTDVSAAQAKAAGSGENSSERTQFPIKFGSAPAKFQRGFLVFCWDCAALVGQIIGREISKLESRHEKRNADKDEQRASSYGFVSSFGVISLQSHMIHPVRFGWIFLYNFDHKSRNSSI